MEEKESLIYYAKYLHCLQVKVVWLALDKSSDLTRSICQQWCEKGEDAWVEHHTQVGNIFLSAGLDKEEKGN